MTHPNFDLYSEINLDLVRYELRQAIEYSFSRRILILLWTVHPDIAHFAVCWAIRQKYRTSMELLPFPEEELEDRIYPVLSGIMKEVFMAKDEMKAFLALLEKRMWGVISNNVFQKALDEYDKQGW